MRIIFTTEESEKYFHLALCNIGSLLTVSGCELDWNETDYKRAKRSLQNKIKSGEIILNTNNTICTEDVLVEILRIGKTLKVNDIDGEGEYTKKITLADVHKRVAKTPIRHLSDMINEDDDAYSAFALLQTVFFEKEIFG